MRVSIIIPVYNVEKYLKRCIESARKQTYKDIEIILVDDGSEDNSGILCDTYAHEDNRILVVHKKNGGLSSARNAGNRIATGDFIFYLDSDDYLAQNCIEKLVSLSIDNNADISIIQMLYISEDTNDEIRMNVNEETKSFTAEKAIEESLYQRYFSCCAPAKLYKKDIIEGIDFPEGRLSEDLATCHLFFHKAKKIASTNVIGYYYRQHDNSIMHVFNPRRMDALKWSKQIEKFCENEYPEIIRAARCRTFNVAVHLILDLEDKGEMHDKYLDKLWNEVKRTRINTIFDKKVRFREKAAAVLSFGGERLLRKIWNSKLAVKKEKSR